MFDDTPTAQDLGDLALRLAPDYVQIADMIAGRIERGDLIADRPIPSKIHLQQEFGVARDTVRAAVALLRERGLVRTVRGKGTYVIGSPPGGDRDRTPRKMSRR